MKESHCVRHATVIPRSRPDVGRRRRSCRVGCPPRPPHGARRSVAWWWMGSPPPGEGGPVTRRLHLLSGQRGAAHAAKQKKKKKKKQETASHDGDNAPEHVEAFVREIGEVRAAPCHVQT